MICSRHRLYNLLSVHIMTDKVQLGGRIPQELLNRIREEAERGRRTIGTTVEMLLEEALAVRDERRQTAEAVNSSPRRRATLGG